MKEKYLKKAIQERDVKCLCNILFKVNPSPMQQEIIRAIAFQEHNRICITAFTRYGKSLSVSLGTALYLLFNRDKKVNLIAPILDQTVILRGYMAEHMVSCPLFYDLLPQKLDMIERLRSEFNKSRIMLDNGCGLRVFSAEGKAERLMGWGGNLIILDESCLIPFETYRQKISRMLGDDPNAILVEIGNPWHRLNQFWEHWNDPGFMRIHIGYEDGIREGRITRKFVEEQKKMLTPQEFQILYLAEFPEDTENTLIRSEWINKALQQKFKFKKSKTEILYGLDVAEGGNDCTVLIKVLHDLHLDRYKVEGVWWWHERDTMKTVGKVLSHVKDDKEAQIKIETTGVGKGPADRLTELEYNVVEFKSGESPRSKRDKTRFTNKKAQTYWNLRTIFEEFRIQIIDEGKLKLQLNAMKYERPGSTRKIIIVDPDDSPDFSDALDYACSDEGFAFAI